MESGAQCPLSQLKANEEEPNRFFTDISGLQDELTLETYQIFLCDLAGNAVSDVQNVIADKTGEQGADRTFRIRFTPKNADYDKTASYCLTICRKETGKMVEQIAFARDVDF